MIWIAMCLFILGMLAWSMIKDWSMDAQGSLMFGFLIACIVPVIVILTGMQEYPKYIAAREYALSLGQEIENVRGATYKAEPGRAAIVGGSLDNMQQSSKLSEYISKYAEAKSAYNRDVLEVQTRKEIGLLWWFGNVAFIDERIMDLEPIGETQVSASDFSIKKKYPQFYQYPMTDDQFNRLLSELKMKQEKK